ncbi:hypothetical protein ACLM5J_04100 [Nocardioides sp. Bht2]|uniref:hypothetical protein n=1 Tax=Nocardioides sp. Bht2 TaxID=3392297 RepID=UPI0039B54DE1
MKRLAYVGASVLLAMAVTAGCSDDKDSDGGGKAEVASKDDFCAAMTKLTTAAQGDEEKPFRDALSDFVDTGVPESVKGDALKGFELFTKALDGVDWEKRSESPELPAADQKLVAAFIKDYSALCVTADDGGDQPSPTE